RIRNDGGRRCAEAIVGGTEAAPKRRLNTEHVKEIPGGGADVDLFREFSAPCREIVFPGRIDKGQLGGFPGRPLPVPKRAGGDRQIDCLLFLFCLVKRDQLGRIVERQRLEKNGANHSEDGDVAAERETDHKNCRAGQPQGSRKAAKTEAEVTKEKLHGSPAPGGSGFFLDRAEMPKALDRRAARFLGVHPGREVLLDLLIEMKAQLSIKLRAGPRTAERCQLCPKFMEPAHGRPPSSTTRLMAAE